MDNYISGAINNSLDSAHSNKTVQSSKALLNGNVKDIDDAAKEFEAVFISQMLRPMFDTVGVSETFGGGRSEEIWKDMLIEEYGKVMIENGGIGIAASVKSELLKMQEVQQQENFDE